MTSSDLLSYYNLYLQTSHKHVGEITHQISILTELTQDEVFEEIYRIAHSLKGSSSMMGFVQIANICEQIDQLITTSKTKKITKSAQALSQLTEDIKIQLLELDKKKQKTQTAS